ncbi:MAG TPA: hypothetical protein VEX38_04805 [Fimbriimonadaceae bacterium]|nr:hypothetical protein [Fimbriimonadaceae bacterium]
MWVFLNDAFLSVVAHRDLEGMLLVRSRIEGDIERAIPGAEVFTNESADYLFRAVVSRDRFKECLCFAVDRIDYGNFKNSIEPEDLQRRRAYHDVWGVLAQSYGAFGSGSS